MLSVSRRTRFCQIHFVSGCSVFSIVWTSWLLIFLLSSSGFRGFWVDSVLDVRACDEILRTSCMYPLMFTLFNRGSWQWNLYNKCLSTKSFLFCPSFIKPQRANCQFYVSNGRNTRFKSSFLHVNKYEDVTHKNKMYGFYQVLPEFVMDFVLSIKFRDCSMTRPIPLRIISQFVRFTSTSSKLSWVEMSGDVSPCSFRNQAMNLSNSVRNICFSSGGWFRKPTEDSWRVYP